MLNWIRERRQRKETAIRLREALIEQSRQPDFYRDLGVPDTMLGRYEMVCLHAYLLLRRLKGEGVAGRALAQTLHNVIFDDFDVALREVGVGDMGIGKRIKKLAYNLHGRISAYEQGLAAGDEDMAAALRRNLYASVEPTDAQVSAMTAYIRDARNVIDGADLALILAVRPPFPDPVSGGAHIRGRRGHER
tara:strand:- start:2095 stop:2667 length:573 start_codon:yes stop_codon:yes gene_type:complete